jgi:hypothetical protein
VILLPRAPLSRRTLLRGLLGGAAVGVGLPFLEAFLPSRAWACGGVVPRRFGVFYWGNGVRPERWVPTAEGEGDAWGLSEELAPLSAVKHKLAVLSGLSVKTPNLYPHTSGVVGLLTGMGATDDRDGTTVLGPTIDQIVAAEIGGQTVYRSLQTSATGANGVSYNGPGSRNPPEASPFALYERIFGATFRAPGEEGLVDPTLALRQSVLDAVSEDISALNARVGASDRARLDQHLTGIRELELRLSRLQEDPPNLAACVRPPEPLPEYPDIDGRPQVAARSRALCDLLVMSMACDQTRVIGHYMNDPVSNTLFEGTDAGHHDLTHNETDDQPQVHAITVQIIEELAYLLEAMDTIDEGDGTLLDNSCILATTDVSLGQTHSLDDMPIVVAGSACGRLRTDLHVRSISRESTSHAMLSLVRAMDINAASFGGDEGLATDGYPEIEA